MDLWSYPKKFETQLMAFPCKIAIGFLGCYHFQWCTWGIVRCTVHTFFFGVLNGLYRSDVVSHLWGAFKFDIQMWWLKPLRKDDQKIFTKDQTRYTHFLSSVKDCWFFRLMDPNPAPPQTPKKKGCRSQRNTWTLATSHHGCNPWLRAATKEYRNWNTRI